MFGSTKNKKRQLGEFEELIASQLDGLYGAALRYTRNKAQAEDLVQDTVVRALRFRDSFEPGTNFRAWIFTILTHTFIHRYRRSKREREILEGQSRLDVERQLRSESTREQAERPEHSYFKDLLSDDVTAALEALPDDFRTVVVLCDIEGLSYKEIAEAVGAPVGTVMSRLYRGRRILEGKLANLAIEQGIIKSTPGASAASDESEKSLDSVVDLNSFRRRKSG